MIEPKAMKADLLGLLLRSSHYASQSQIDVDYSVLSLCTMARHGKCQSGSYCFGAGGRSSLGNCFSSSGGIANVIFTENICAVGSIRMLAISFGLGSL